MKKIIAITILTLSLFSCKKSFLDVPPATGLTDDKLKDIPSMKGLIAGAYGQERGTAWNSMVDAALMVRDIQVINNEIYPQYFNHQVYTDVGLFTLSFTTLGLLNTVAVSNVEAMEGSDADKNAVLGDMHFLRALIYFDLNNYFDLPSTGYTVPLVQTPIGVNDKVACSKTIDVMNFIESEIEQARVNFASVSGIANYNAATALAARIYFFHKKYDKAYQCANEVINSGAYSLETTVSKAFQPGYSSRENIFSFIYSASDGAGYLAPTLNLYNAYQANQDGYLVLYPEGDLSKLMEADPADARYNSFFTVIPGFYTFIDQKYSSDQMSLPYIRLAEMYLTRAEADIMNNNAVNQQDVDDINKLRKRANPSTMLTAIPTEQEALDLIFDDRVKEMCIEMGDHYLNCRRLQKGIIKIPSEGTGLKPYSEYADLLVFPFPINEVTIYGLTRNP